MAARSHALPAPGVLWGLYPERSETRARAPRAGRRLGGSGRGERYRRMADAAGTHSSAWAALAASAAAERLGTLRARLRREGFSPDALAEALGCVDAAAQRVLGVALYATQRYAAAVLLDGQLAEMATGEGKTLAAAAAAAVAALAGTPVHVVTANDYLAARDAAALAPLYQSLGLTVGLIQAERTPEERRAAYRAGIVYCTARELVFDYLRDRLGSGGCTGDLERRALALQGGSAAPPLLRGLCMAILDEADSILLDEATMPLVLSRKAADPGRRAALWQALTIARGLEAGAHFCLHPDTRTAQLTAAGAGRIAERAADLGGPWRSQRRREELVRTALAALHAYRRDHDYQLRDAQVEIIDAVTGRGAPGRVWSRGLHNLIELKEGCPPSEDTQTLAQITYQRFFARFIHLAGMSGTLGEARRELRSTYGLDVVEVPLRCASRRRQLPMRLYPDRARLWPAVAERVIELRRRGRAVLVGTDSVADSEALARHLADAGVPHAVLNARRHGEEAGIVAAAGRAGAVTVATNMAGRGTDIALGPGVAAAGGLHVLSCQLNAARRIDRQLAGRAARQGDPGSCEAWLALDAPRLHPGVRSILARMIRYFQGDVFVHRPQRLLRALIGVSQWLAERQEAAQRRRLLNEDRELERRALFAPPRDRGVS